MLADLGVDEARVEEKFIALGLIFETLQSSIWGATGVSGLYLNPAVARNLIVSYFYDIERMKRFHQFSLVDEAKQACYWVKWIVKEKPVQFNLPIEAVGIEHRLANEKMAFLMASASLRIKPSMISETFTRVIMDTLHYKHFEEDSFLPLCDLLWRLSCGARNGDVTFRRPI